ncbi:MAG: glycosyltransferase family 4 protein [Planctomycetes bacterium]|jgi:glycosyltransferase involved in cell wall biosynthesis|nr:glycosyltransferase family 4 protein [Planctomycetota bacterium]
MSNSNKRKRIGIDARFYGPVGKGLGRYVQEIVDNILLIDRDNEYVIFLTKENFDEFVTDNKRVKKVLADMRWYTLKEQLFFPFLIWRERLDLIHFPHFNVPVLTPGKFIVTVHDLILTRFPTVRATTLSPWLYRFKNAAYKVVINLAIKRAQKVITVSQFTKQDILERFSINPQKIVITYEGVANLAKGRDSLFTAKLDDKETLLGYNIENDFLLYVGNAYPHKNLEQLINVFSRLSKQQPQLRLVLVGKEDYFYSRLKMMASDLGLWRKNDGETKIIFPGYVPDAQLEVLYKKARAYIFPSLYEGFGLPPLEAMARGCPVLSSDRASLPEILGSAALYFNPEDNDDLNNKIVQLLNDENLRQKLVELGYKQIKNYNWWECANQTLKEFKAVLEK